MGKIISKPKMPSAPVYVVEPPPAAVTAPEPIDDAPAEPTEDEQRLANILRRQRGRLGTVATSVGGILTPSAGPVRKTLLGE